VKEPLPVNIKIGSINETGFMTIEFNQKLVKPNFGSSTKGRNLLSMDEIDIHRDVIEFDFIVRSDDESIQN
jgi:hypothetical protein